MEKDCTSTLMDLDEKMACVSGIMADVTLNPNLLNLVSRRVV